MAHWFRSDSSLLEKLYPDMVSPADDGITIGRVLELELSVSHGLPSTEAIAENDLVIYRLLHLVIFFVNIPRVLTGSLQVTVAKLTWQNFCAKLVLYMSGLNIMLAKLNKDHLARLPPKPGNQLKKSGRSHLPGSSPTTSWSYDYKTPVIVP